MHPGAFCMKLRVAVPTAEMPKTFKIHRCNDKLVFSMSFHANHEKNIFPILLYGLVVKFCCLHLYLYLYIYLNLFPYLYLYLYLDLYLYPYLYHIPYLSVFISINPVTPNPLYAPKIALAMAAKCFLQESSIKHLNFLQRKNHRQKTPNSGR